MLRHAVLLLALAASCSAADKLSVLIVDGVNNHDWAAGTRVIKTILEGTGRFTVDVSTYPAKPDFTRYNVSAMFEQGQLVRHTKFGDGVVTRILDANKVEVLFKDEPRTLAQGLQ